MRKFDLIAVAAAVSAAIAFAGPASALTAKKMTYEQYATCKKQLDADQLARQRGERHDVGADCMQKYGFRLKKKAKI